MKKIDTPPVHPERLPHVRIENETCDWIRVPTSGQYIDAIAGSEGLGPVQRGEYVLGAVIRLVWRSHKYELEQTEPRAVFMELYDAGWSEAEIVAFGETINEHISATHTSEQDVQDASAFTDATPPKG